MFIIRLFFFYFEQLSHLHFNFVNGKDIKKKHKMCLWILKDFLWHGMVQDARNDQKLKQILLNDLITFFTHFKSVSALPS